MFLKKVRRAYKIRGFLILTKYKRSQFYSALRSVSSYFKWSVDDYGKIRGTYKRNKYCPLTAIARILTGKRHYPENYDYIDLGIDLSLDDRNEVIDVADNNWYNKNLRRQIEKIIGV